MTAPTLAWLLQGFFTERLARHRQASPQTFSVPRHDPAAAAVRRTARRRRTPSLLTIDDLDAATVGEFLTHLDTERRNSTETRNARLAAIHSFYRYDDCR